MKKTFRILTILWMGSIATPLHAHPLEDSAVVYYDSGRFEEAAAFYDRLLAEEPQNPWLLYNRGNCAYKLGRIGEAIRYFLAAYRIRPLNEDIRHNLEMALARAPDEIPLPEPFFVFRWLGIIGSLLPIRTWWILALGTGAIAMTLMGIYAFGFQEVWRRWGFYGSLVAAGLSVLFFLPAFVHGQQLKQPLTVVVVPECEVSSEPSTTAPKLFVLHEGAVAHLRDSTASYFLIMIDSRRQGWVKRENVEIL
ncbi:MAG: tetratricopeptide repeat protein [Flavobacteriales bacterium]|nr:tetratricopeptide repeat protein [Flavobacteriales bacterium]MCX7768486.1 tetratricopeptide repeat protein [Flavobacteriales bacterium]MDW8409819.1 tetratricopeptide repeat protein [Flavobacteriales bacterium]